MGPRLKSGWRRKYTVLIGGRAGRCLTTGALPIAAHNRRAPTHAAIMGLFRLREEIEARGFCLIPCRKSLTDCLG